MDSMGNEEIGDEETDEFDDMADEAMAGLEKAVRLI